MISLGEGESRLTFVSHDRVHTTSPFFGVFALHFELIRNLASKGANASSGGRALQATAGRPENDARTV